MTIITKKAMGWGKALSYLLGVMLACAANSAWAADVAVSAKSPALIPAPREIVLTGGACASVANLKIERVAGIPAEGYELSVKPDGVTIRAFDKAGEFYALQRNRRQEMLVRLFKRRMGKT